MQTQKSGWEQIRRQGLRRFAIAITVLNVLGHAWFGFEQSFAQPLAALTAAYITELTLELIDARANRRRPRFLGGAIHFVDFLLSAHITGLACAMLLYANNRVLPVVLAVVVGLGSKALLRVKTPAGPRHFLNPSNFGITTTLLLLPWVGIAPPYHFTENLGPTGDWVLPALIVTAGTFLNARFTRKLPLIAAWLSGFLLQAALRSAILHTPLVAALLPTTGVAFILYTFYMVTDPATTPQSTHGQMVFGFSVAGAYGLLMSLHIVFGLFFALTMVSAARGAYMLRAWVSRRVAPAAVEEAPALIGASS
jgi:hypothetical protein